MLLLDKLSYSEELQVGDDDHSEETTSDKGRVGSCGPASEDLRKLVKRPVDTVSHGKDEDDLPPLIQVLPDVVVDLRNRCFIQYL